MRTPDWVGANAEPDESESIERGPLSDPIGSDGRPRKDGRVLPLRSPDHIDYSDAGIERRRTRD